MITLLHAAAVAISFTAGPQNLELPNLSAALTCIMITSGQIAGTKTTGSSSLDIGFCMTFRYGLYLIISDPSPCFEKQPGIPSCAALNPRAMSPWLQSDRILILPSLIFLEKALSIPRISAPVYDEWQYLTFPKGIP